MICEVIVEIDNFEVDKIFDYILPEDLKLSIGQRVLVPFGNRQIEGYIIKIKDKTDYDSSKLKSVIKSLDDFSYFNDETFALMQYLIETYNLRYADCIRLFVPNVVRKNIKEKFIKFAKLIKFDSKLNEKQQKIFDYLKENENVELNFLNKNFSSSSVKTLINKNVIEVYEIKHNRAPYEFKNINNCINCILLLSS